MVTTPSPDTLRRDSEDRWLCNIVAKCEGVASLQAPLPCPTGCDAAVAQHERLIAGKREEANLHEAALDRVRAEMAAAVEAGSPLVLSAVEQTAVRLGAVNLKQLRADIAKLEAVRERVAEEHTHPVMACAEHEKKLAQLVDEST